jgi:hypothetical protein
VHTKEVVCTVILEIKQPTNSYAEMVASMEKVSIHVMKEHLVVSNCSCQVLKSLMQIALEMQPVQADWVIYGARSVSWIVYHYISPTCFGRGRTPSSH